MVCLVAFLYAVSAVEATLAQTGDSAKQWKRVDVSLDTKNIQRFARAFDRKRAAGFLSLLRQTNIDRAFAHHREQFHFTVTCEACTTF